MARPGPAAGFDNIRHPQKRATLLAYAVTMQIDRAVQAAKIHRSMHYHWLKVDPDYKAAFAEAREHAADALEAEAVRRAKDGCLRVIYHQGEPIGSALVYSDSLMAVLLKGAKPDIYKERYEHSGPGGGPIQVQHLAPDARQARLAALLAKRNGPVPVSSDGAVPQPTKA